MPTMTNKQQLLNHAFTLLKKQYGSGIPEHESRTVLDQLLYAVCREDASRDKADAAFQRLQTCFIDWNEVRVSAVYEIEEVLKDLPHAGAKAQTLVGVLQEWFEQTYSFNMEDLAKKGLKAGAKQLSRLADINDFAVAWVMLHGFGGHAIPLDIPMLRVLRRLGAIEDESNDTEAIRGAVEHAIPKAKASVFYELVSVLADKSCHEDRPKCSGCSLKGECPTGQEMARHSPEPKPRKPR